mmetsp:Transcript_2097/g.6401  ORF Transcript_2097/g.6401 Transcript_2097/m.6401 type:complete len:184 (-) Transcript_2097:651-1202(-)
MRSRAVNNGQSRLDDDREESNEDVEEAEIKSSSSSSRRYDSVGEKWTIAMPLFCLGIFFGVILSLSIEKSHAMLKEPMRGLHRNVQNMYRAHNAARKEYLRSYREAYLESILAARGPSSSSSSSFPSRSQSPRRRSPLPPLLRSPTRPNLYNSHESYFYYVFRLLLYSTRLYLPSPSLVRCSP